MFDNFGDRIHWKKRLPSRLILEFKIEVQKNSRWNTNNIWSWPYTTNLRAYPTFRHPHPPSKLKFAIEGKLMCKYYGEKVD